MTGSLSIAGVNRNKTCCWSIISDESVIGSVISEPYNGCIFVKITGVAAIIHSEESEEGEQAMIFFFEEKYLCSAIFDFHENLSILIDYNSEFWYNISEYYFTNLSQKGRMT